PANTRVKDMRLIGALSDQQNLAPVHSAGRTHGPLRGALGSKMARPVKRMRAAKGRCAYHNNIRRIGGLPTPIPAAGQRRIPGGDRLLTLVAHEASSHV